MNDMNAMAILCAGKLLEHPQIIDDYVMEVERGIHLLESAALDMGLEPYPTHANFMLIRVEHRCNPNELVSALKTRGYLVKGSLPSCISDCIRVTVGPPNIMSAFASSLRSALEEVQRG